MVTSAAVPPAVKPAIIWWLAPIGKAKHPPASRGVRSSTQFSAVAYRTKLFNAKDMPNVVKIQAGYKAQPLSAYLKQPAPQGGTRDQFPEDRQRHGED